MVSWIVRVLAVLVLVGVALPGAALGQQEPDGHERKVSVGGAVALKLIAEGLRIQ